MNWSDATASLDPATRALAVKRITDPAKAAGLVSTGFMEAITGAQAIANNKGLFAYNRSTSSVLTTTVRTADGTGSGWGGATHHDWSRIDRVDARRRARRRRRAARSIPSRSSRGATRSCSSRRPSAISCSSSRARSTRARADEGRSFFSLPGGKNKIGQKVVDERVTITSDPFDPEVAGVAVQW